MISQEMFSRVPMGHPMGSYDQDIYVDDPHIHTCIEILPFFDRAMAPNYTGTRKRQGSVPAIAHGA